MLRLCVIGDPVGHSRSPAIQSALLRRAGIAGEYTAVTVTPDTLADFVAQAKAGAWDGFNVTMPLKTLIVPLLDAPDASAAKIGAVNTVVIRQGRAIGYNTDAPGAVQALGGEVRGKRVLVLGNGGASKAVCCGLAEAGAEVTVCARHPRGAERPWEELCMLAADCDVLLNATPLGMTGKGQFADWRFLEALPQGCTVFDLVYEPEETELLRRSAQRGQPTIGGLVHLRAQAELSFTRFIE